MTRPSVVEWLSDPRQPAIRYRTLRELMGRPADDPEVQEARSGLARSGWAAEILAEREPSGVWAGPDNLYRPKYTATNWRMLVLADLGLTREDPGVARACEIWMDRLPMRGGGVGGLGSGAAGHHCLVGNMTRALLRFGYGEDRRVLLSLDWLVKSASPLGGWSCYGTGRNLDSWEGLSALAELPKARHSAAMDRVIASAAEFFLERELHRQGAPYAPWRRFHYPVHYYYDILVGLDLLTRLGYAGDRRLRYAVDLLKEKQRSDGRWNLDAVHPDVTGSMARWFQEHPRDRPVPWALETPGAPSRMVTLTALNVLQRLEA